MDGSSIRQLTFERDPDVNVGVPIWSPAGDWIVFVVAHEARSALWLIRPDGSGLHELVHRGWGPCWERDGRHLIYTTGQDGPTRLERIAMDGGAPVVGPSHTIGRIAASRVPVSVRLLQLFLSPDGQWLATPLLDGATSNVWALPTSGGLIRPLTDFGDRSNVIARSVSWSADGQSLFAAVAETETDIVLFDGLIR
jgi:Tol biopolymer transport system component